MPRSPKRLGWLAPERNRKRKMKSVMDWESLFNEPPRKKTRAVICDIDDILCTEFDKPIGVACRFLAQLDRSVEVHYVTARPEASRAGTEQFLEDHRLPGRRNLYFCPRWKSSREHKTEVMQRLAKEYEVIVSIGDADEDEQASRSAGLCFVQVRDDNVDQAWQTIAGLIGPTISESGSSSVSF